MHKVLIILPLLNIAAIGGEAGEFIEQPNLVGKITEALVVSKFDHLTPKLYQQEGRRFSYHLKSVSYLGTIERGKEKFLLATALFIRSSTQGCDQPPPRGHGYLLCLTPKFRLVSHCSLDLPGVELSGAQLRRNGQVIGDFADTNVATRRRGFLIDGTSFLPYPFADKLSEKNHDHSTR